MSNYSWLGIPRQYGQAGITASLKTFSGGTVRRLPESAWASVEIRDPEEGSSGNFMNHNEMPGSLVIGGWAANQVVGGRASEWAPLSLPLVGLTSSTCDFL